MRVSPDCCPAPGCGGRAYALGGLVGCEIVLRPVGSLHSDEYVLTDEVHVHEASGAQSMRFSGRRGLVVGTCAHEWQAEVTDE